jgi:chromate transporter
MADRVETAAAAGPSLIVVSWGEAFRTWARVAALSFGGPTGQIAVMHRILVDEKKWIGEERFLHALNYCMLLPGPEAQQLATYIGWLMHGMRGGLMAGTLFILPGAVSILLLSIAYACFQQTVFLQALFFGLKPAVMAIVIEAVLRIGKRVLKNSTMVALAALSFVAIFFFDAPFPLVILAAGLFGFVGGRVAPDRFCVIKGHGGKTVEGGHDTVAMQPAVQPSFGRAARVSAIWLTLWFAPLAVLWLWLGEDSVYVRQGLFFSQAAVVTFGGAYSVLAYVAQQAVENYAWLEPGEMLDGLGMAETTPGPLIMVVQFVAFLGAYRNPGPFSPLAAGIAGSLITTWVTFVPCFYWIFLGAPHIEQLRGSRLLNSALSSITAAVVGVVLNLSVWFALHTLFGKVETLDWHGMRLLVPQPASASLSACTVAVLACLLTFYWKKSMTLTLALSAGAGVMLYYFAK